MKVYVVGFHYEPPVKIFSDKREAIQYAVTYRIDYVAEWELGPDGEEKVIWTSHMGELVPEWMREMHNGG